jgi:hypothetical protein
MVQRTRAAFPDFNETVEDVMVDGHARHRAEGHHTLQSGCRARASGTSIGRSPRWWRTMVGGCNLQSGDLFGSCTISGPASQEASALVQLNEGRRKPLTLDNGEQRSFLNDGDSIIFRGWCEKPDVARIGFGELRGQIVEPT